MRAELSDVPNWVSEIKRKGYVIVPNFLTAQEVGVIKRAFETEVPTVRMPGLGDNTGNTIRAHNLLAKTRSTTSLVIRTQRTSRRLVIRTQRTTRLTTTEQDTCDERKDYMFSVCSCKYKAL